MRFTDVRSEKYKNEKAPSCYAHTHGAHSSTFEMADAADDDGVETLFVVRPASRSHPFDPSIQGGRFPSSRR
tara:strand:- start:296 stop:511 length:216 start_codon:yes stop_codon:yes gene_type:complete